MKYKDKIKIKKFLRNNLNKEGFVDNSGFNERNFIGTKRICFPNCNNSIEISFLGIFNHDYLGFVIIDGEHFSINEQSLRIKHLFNKISKPILDNFLEDINKAETNFIESMYKKVENNDVGFLSISKTTFSIRKYSNDFTYTTTSIHIQLINNYFYGNILDLDLGYSVTLHRAPKNKLLLKFIQDLEQLRETMQLNHLASITGLQTNNKEELIKYYLENILTNLEVNRLGEDNSACIQSQDSDSYCFRYFFIDYREYDNFGSIFFNKLGCFNTIDLKHNTIFENILLKKINATDLKLIKTTLIK